MDELYEHVLQKRNISILSQGGTGKSTLISLLKEKLEETQDLQFHVTSTTGVSAYLIGGRTIHSFSGMGVIQPKHSVQDVMKKIKKNKDAKKRIMECDILVIDEVSMLQCSYFNMMNECFKLVRKNNTIFGGIQLIVTGDFLQLPPINDQYVFESDLWHQFNFHDIKLTKLYRFTDETYASMLSRIRIGKHTPEDNIELFKRLKAYNELNESDLYDIQPTFLSSRREDVSSKNKEELDKNPNELVIYLARDTHESKDSVLDLVAPKKIEMKCGAQVMLTINHSIEEGLTNGSRGVVMKLTSDTMFVKFMNGMTIPFERHEFKYEENNVTSVRLQFPFMLAYCLTIHKCQGSTLDCAVVDIGNSVFENHMIYVALSRVKSLDGLYIKSYNPYRIKVDQKVIEFYGLN